MKRMVIFEQAMCCPTGVCGPSANNDLLRISTLVSNLSKHNVLVERYNLSSNPQIFVDNKEINEILKKEGVNILPVTMVDGKIVKTKAYPSGKEIITFLEIPPEFLQGIPQNQGGCCGGGGTC